VGVSRRKRPFWCRLRVERQPVALASHRVYLHEATFHSREARVETYTVTITPILDLPDGIDVQ